MKTIVKRVLLLLAVMLPLATLAQSYQSVPYTEDFENGSGSPMLPTGWVNYQTGSSGSGTFPCCYPYPGNAHGGSYYFELETNAGHTELVATCEFANPAALMVDMWINVYSSSYMPDYFEVGVMEDTVFVPVDTLSITTTSSWSSYGSAPYRIYLADYSGDGHRIAFRCSKSSGSYTVFIDDMTISYAPSCAYPVQSYSATVDSSSATLTWDAPSTSAGYFVFFNGDSTWYNTSTNSLSFTGLDANTAYSGYIYNTCTGGDTSEFLAFSFRTACGMPVFPIVEDFNSYTESFPSCWNIIEQDGNYPRLSSSAARNGGKGIELYSYNHSLSFATPFLYHAANTVETKFWTRKNSTYYSIDMAVGYTTSIDNVDSVVWVDTISVGDSWAESTVSLGNVASTDQVYLVYRKIGTAYTSMYIDDITIREVRSCGIPTDFRATGTASGQQSFAWTDTNATAWDIAYGMVGMDPDTCTAIQSFTADTATVTGLEDTITYDFYVRADCGSEQSYWVGPITARPNLIIMRANQRDTIRTCGGTIVDDGGLDGNFATSQSSRLYIYPSEPGKTVHLTGTATTVGSYTYNTNTLTIYEGIGSSGRVLGTYANSSNSTIDVASTTGPITLKFESSYYAGPGFQLTVSCDDLASCTDPYDVEVSDVAGASALLSWSYADATPAESFTITVTDTANGTSTTFTAADSARSMLLSGLTQTTDYYVTVEANCSSTDISNPVGAYFTTSCYVGGSVDCGNGTASLNHIINTFYNYSISQMLFTSDEINSLQDSIFGIEFYVNSATSASVPLDIYLDTTSVNSYASGSSFIPMDSANLVWSGSVVLQPGVNTFNFSTPFIRPNTTSNLVLTLDNNTGSYSSQSYIRGTGGLTGKTLYQYSDGTNHNPLGSLSLSTTDNRANITFLAHCGDASCVAPTVALGGANANDVTINWVPGMSESSWTVEYKLHSDTTWTVAVASTSAQTYNVTGLSANTQYDFRVGSLCAVSDNVPYGYTSARTACATMSRSTLPMLEGFEGYTTGSIPNCWVAPQTGTSGSGTFPCNYEYSSNARTGSVYFEMEASSGGTEVFALPAFDTIDGLSLEFWVATTSYYAPDALEFGTLSNADVFTPLDTVDLSNCTSLYSYVKKDMAVHYTGTDNRIAFRATKSSRYTVFMDDFKLYIPNACDSVHAITVDSVSTTSIAVSWTDTNFIGSYKLYLATSNNESSAIDSATTTATSYTFAGLNPSTNYYVFVHAICASGLSDANYIKVTTGCDVINTFPFTEDFEGFEASSSMGSATQVCWYRGTNYSYSYYPYVYSYYNHTSGGSKCLYFYTYSGTYSYLAMPEMENLDTLLLSFYMLGTYPSYYTYKAIVGVMSDQSDVSTFVALDTVVYNENGTNWEKKKVALGNAPDSCHYIAIMANDPSYFSFYIDDISVNYNNGCGDPQNFVVPAVGMTTATVSWTDTANIGSYIVKVSTSNSESAAFFTDTVSTNTASLTGLTGLTTYYVWIYNNCPSGLSDVLTGSFSTLGADPHFLPYDNDFEDPTNTFSIYNLIGGNNWNLGSAVNHGGNNCLYVSNDNGTTNAYTNTNQSISFAITYLQIPYDSSYMISYDWRCQGEGSYDLMRVALAPEDYDFQNSFTAVNRYSNTLPSGWIALDGGKKNLRNTWQYEETEVQLPAGNYYLTLVWTNDGFMGSNPPAAIDNIHMELITCPAPQNLTASSSNSSTIDVSWSAGAASNWIVEYGMDGFAAGTGTVLTTTTNSITLSSLAPSTLYEIRVRPICGVDDTGFVSTTTCLTSCDTLITSFPWVEDFENGISCWDQIYTRGTVAWTTGNGGNAYGGITGAATGESNARFTCNSYNGYTTYLVSPQLSIESDDDVMLTFYHAQPAWGSDQDTMAVLYRTHPDSSWHYIASWNSNIATWQADTVMLPNASANYQIAFMAHSGFGLGILLDSVVVYGTESCTRPAITNVNVGSTSFTATWNSPASAFDVAIREQGAAWPNPQRVTAHTYTFTNLEPSTNYEYRVRSICSDTSESFWATRNFITDTLECYVVEDLVVDGYDYESVTLSWSPDATGHAVAFVVSISNSVVNLQDTVYTNHATVMGLYPDMNYSISVQAMCSATTYSDWCEALSFATATCAPVSNVTVSDVTCTSAVVDWTADEASDQWIVEYGFHGFIEGSGNRLVTSTHPITITGLSDDYTYDVYVSTVCTEDVHSAWSPMVSFITPEAVGIDEVLQNGASCSIYPNPASDAATITVNGINGNVRIVVVDVNGREISAENIECAEDCAKQLSVDGLAQGTYFVHVTSNDVNIVRKLVVR